MVVADDQEWWKLASETVGTLAEPPSLLASPSSSTMKLCVNVRPADLPSRVLAAAFALPAGRLAGAMTSRPAAPFFEEISPAASGITWVHDNGLSEQHYLPETMGPGCAFLDYDNDGWIDISRQQRTMRFLPATAH